eukprot:8616657-Pyramimonas_sp.AAC.1
MLRPSHAILDAYLAALGTYCNHLGPSWGILVVLEAILSVWEASSAVFEHSWGRFGGFLGRQGGHVGNLCCDVGVTLGVSWAVARPTKSIKHRRKSYVLDLLRHSSRSSWRPCGSFGGPLAGVLCRLGPC